jgi:hypothetical protein
MKHRKIEVDNTKAINIYDDVFSYSEMSQMFELAKKSKYQLERIASTTVPTTLQFKTLKSEYTVYDLLWLGFFKGSSTNFLKKEIKENDYRLHRVYINLCTAQDVYHYHTDSPIDNDITLLYYLNTAWESNWEGETHFGDRQGNEIMHTASFLPGRLITFSATIPHKSSQPAFFAPEFRYVLTMKFSSKSHADYKSDFPIADLFVDDNINISDFEKEAINVLHKVTAGLLHSGTTFFMHCFDTYKILKQQNQPLEVCLAGLFHSAYGTEFREGFTDGNREMLQSIIGPKAEELVYRFCNLHDRDKELLDPQCKEIELIRIAYANVLEEKFRDQSEDKEIIAYKNKLMEVER